MKNNQKLINEINNIHSTKNLNKNTILKFYMYERFIERLSLSEYKNNFIIKGGFYLSSILGLHTRTTKDIDTCLKGKTLTKENLYKIMKEITNIPLEDNAQINISKINPIKIKDIYNGFLNILNIKDKISIDVATGDKITPKEIKYKYTTIFEDKTIELIAYNLETLLAEKIHSILSKGETTSRMKDFYDIYLIKKMLWSRIDKIILKKAIINTFKHRNDINILNQNKKIIKTLKDSPILKAYWQGYKKKNNLKIEYSQTIKSLEEINEFII